MADGRGLSTEWSELEGISAGRVHLGVLQPEPQPWVAARGDLWVWVEGEIIDAQGLARRHGVDASDRTSDAEIVATLYRRGGWEFLRDADGVFHLALYDARDHALHLATDRHGLRPLYLTRIRGDLAWAAEVKALLNLPDHSAAIDPEAVGEWFSFGQLLDARTWIRGVELLPPATVLHCTSQGEKRRRYWSWREQRTLPESSDEGELAEALGDLWLRAVRRRMDARPLGQLLSGGLDSRAILAALPRETPSYATLTFGQRGCEDLRIARRAARRKGVPHRFVEIHAGNWLPARIDAVWRTDGMVGVFDLHGCEAQPLLADLCRVQIHGYLGDATVGGSYAGPADPDAYLREWLVTEGPLGLEPAEALARLRALWDRDGFPLDRFLVEQRGRRRINQAVTAAFSSMEVRLPFFDRDFLDFVYALPESLRRESRLYTRMLLERFPELFRSIPWARTGLPIGVGRTEERVRRGGQRAARALRRGARRLGVRAPEPPRRYVDYASWLRAEPARGFARCLLLDREALHPSYVDADRGRRLLEGFETGDSRELSTLGWLLTFEIHLRQLFDPAGLATFAGAVEWSKELPGSRGS